MYDNFRVIGGPVSPCSDKDVDAAERTLGARFPRGYRDYVCQFGAGVLGGAFIRIYPPQRIVADLAQWRARIDEYWFWPKGKLKKANALAAIIVGDALGGDELIFEPRLPDRLYVLPGEAEEVYLAGEGLPAAIEWMCSSGKLTERLAERDFEPFGEQA